MALVPLAILQFEHAHGAVPDHGLDTARRPGTPHRIGSDVEPIQSSGMVTSATWLLASGEVVGSTTSVGAAVDALGLGLGFQLLQFACLLPPGLLTEATGLVEVKIRRRSAPCRTCRSGPEHATLELPWSHPRWRGDACSSTACRYRAPSPSGSRPRGLEELGHALGGGVAVGGAEGIVHVHLRQACEFSAKPAPLLFLMKKAFSSSTTSPSAMAPTFASASGRCSCRSWPPACPAVRSDGARVRRCVVHRPWTAEVSRRITWSCRSGR